MSDRIGFVGLGAMGLPMAINLVRAGFAVRGFDVVSGARESFQAAGGEIAASPGEAASGAGLVHVVVATSAQVEAVLDGEAGVLATLPRGAVVVLHSTVAPAFTRRLADRLAAGGLELLDAPISGGRVGAESGKLTIMASGSDNAFAVADGTFAALAGKVYRLGSEPGVGSTVKMVNQLLAGVHIAAAAEAMALGVRAGADAATLYEVISNSAGNSWMFTNRVPHILERDFTPLSAVEIFVKDLGIVLDQARELRFPLPLSASAHQLFLAAAAAGHGREDDSAVVKVFEALAGIEVGSKD